MPVVYMTQKISVIEKLLLLKLGLLEKANISAFLVRFGVSFTLYLEELLGCMLLVEMPRM